MPPFTFSHHIEEPQKYLFSTIKLRAFLCQRKTCQPPEMKSAKASCVSAGSENRADKSNRRAWLLGFFCLWGYFECVGRCPCVYTHLFECQSWASFFPSFQTLAAEFLVQVLINFEFSSIYGENPAVRLLWQLKVLSDSLQTGFSLSLCWIFTLRFLIWWFWPFDSLICYQTVYKHISCWG